MPGRSKIVDRLGGKLLQPLKGEFDLYMGNKLLKLSVFLFFVGLFLAFGLKGARVKASAGGPDPRSTGAPGEQTCASSACHLGSPVNSGSGSVSLSGIPANYALNQEYTITVTVSQSGRSTFGFQATVIDDQGREVGTFTAGAGTGLIASPVGNNLRRYVRHTTPKETANQGVWTFRWKAPSQSAGRVTFYAAGNAANGDTTQSGDLIYTTSSISQPPVSLASVATVSSASFAQNVALAPNMIVSAFSAAALSQNVVSASTNPLPTELDGTEIEVRDSTSTTRKAGLFFVAPSQINYWIPTGTANGIATISVKRSGSVIAEGTVTIESTSPGIFTANTFGTGVPAAVALRVVGATQTFESIYTNSGGTITATPIDLANGDVYLILFGTGIIGAAANTVSATIGGTSTPILGFAAAPGFVGLDQVAVGPIPKSLTMRGNVDVILTVGSKVANTVSINIK